MDMPHHLRTLPPEALDILRYFHTLKAPSAHADQIIEGAGLSDRGFGKAIRRLVTKSYLVMDGDQVYRLSDNGKRVVEELSNYDENAPEPEAEETPESDEPRFVTRHLVLVTPRVFQAGQPTNVLVGFDDADDDEIVKTASEVILRLNVLHGEPSEVKETSLVVENRAAHQVFEVTAGQFTQMRIRVQVCQIQDGAADNCSGLYADLPVGVGEVDSTLTAFGTNVLLREAPPQAVEAVTDEYDFE
ncbi:MAG TPA: hypothetical protein VK003_08260 [Oceanobacillus sp.]|nr:hypothetical protein [Oceanobacillus sp.]